MHIAVQVTGVDENAAVIYRSSDIIDPMKGLHKKPLCYSRSVALPGPTFGASPDDLIPDLGWHGHRGAICDLAVIIDHTFYQQIAHSDVSVATSLVTQHITQADYIFRSTDIDLDSLPDNIGFMIKTIKIYNSQYTTADYRLRDLTLDKETAINRLCTYDFTRYCLAVAFTFRNFGQILSFIFLVK